jgi:hypothetical protein
VERYGVVRRGSLKACIGILLGIWAAFSIVTAAIVLVVFLLLRSMLRDWLAATLPRPLFNAGYVVIIVCIILAVVSGVVAGFSEVRGAIGAARRRRFLFDPGSASPGDTVGKSVSDSGRPGIVRRQGMVRTHLGATEWNPCAFVRRSDEDPKCVTISLFPALPSLPCTATSTMHGR